MIASTAKEQWLVFLPVSFRVLHLSVTLSFVYLSSSHCNLPLPALVIYKHIPGFSGNGTGTPLSTFADFVRHGFLLTEFNLGGGSSGPQKKLVYDFVVSIKMSCQDPLTT